MYRYLFGPVPSRRLGRSLGIDLVPLKTCTFDCVFCQVGRTTRETIERAEYVPVDAVAAELEDWTRAGGRADCVTLAGSGEPTLHARFGDVLDIARTVTGARVALLSNGSLFDRSDVRRDAARADLVKGSLSAWDESSYRQVNRGCAGLSFERIVEGLRIFRSEFTGEMWLEVMIVAGVNDAPEQVARIAAIAARIGPDRVHLNTVVRPPADADARAVDPAQLTALAALFRPPAEVIASFGGTPPPGGGRPDATGLLALVERHPSTVEQLAAVANLPVARVRSELKILQNEGRVRCRRQGGDLYYEGARPDVR